MILIGIGVGCALIFAILSALLSAYSCIQVEAFKKSTHQITYIDPTTQNFSTLSSEDKNKMAQEDQLGTIQ